MKIDDAISTIKTFFLEFLGFLIPGIIFWYTIFVFLKFNNQQEINKFIQFNGSEYIIIIISYVTGYALYGLCEWINEIKLLNQILGPGDWKNQIINLKEYKRSLKKLNNGIEDDLLKINIEDVKSARRLVMSSLPENENDKVYNFMFRAELSQKSAIAILACVLISLFSILIEKIFGKNIGICRNDYYFISFYFFSFIPIFLLIKTYKRFYDIAMKIPFSIYITSRINTEHDS